MKIELDHTDGMGTVDQRGNTIGYSHFPTDAFRGKADTGFVGDMRKHDQACCRRHSICEGIHISLLRRIQHGNFHLCQGNAKTLLQHVQG
nr:hypothetical protein [Thiolapillus sp.]